MRKPRSTLPPFQTDPEIDGSTTSESISLADEIDILKKYLEIEALRFNQTLQLTLRSVKELI